MPTPKNIPMNAAIISFTSKIPVPMLKSLSTNSDNSKNKTTANVTANVRLIFKPIPVKQIPAGIKRAILSIKSRKKNHISDSSICDAIAQFRIKCDKKSNGIRLINISMLSMSKKSFRTKALSAQQHIVMPQAIGQKEISTVRQRNVLSAEYYLSA